MDATAREIHEWAELHFTHDALGIAAHLLSEAAELYQACGGVRSEGMQIVARSFKESAPMIAEETADVMILASTMAGYMGFSLEAEVEAKMERNKKRQWGTTNIHGYTEHLD